MVFNPETAKSLLLFSFRHQIPLIGHRRRGSRPGALYALDRDYSDIGVQCAEMAEQDSRWPVGGLAAAGPATQGALHPEPEDRGADEARAARPGLPRRRGSGGVRSGDATPPTQHRRQAAAAHDRAPFSRRRSSSSASRCRARSATAPSGSPERVRRWRTWWRRAASSRSTPRTPTGCGRSPRVFGPIPRSRYVRFLAADGHQIYGESLLPGVRLPKDSGAVAHTKVSLRQPREAGSSGPRVVEMVAQVGGATSAGKRDALGRRHGREHAEPRRGLVQLGLSEELTRASCAGS